ncbi:BFD-like [2Fe-2S] binding domain-containing protein [Ruegeria halocynthiae]|uniref:BFD-like [2Fe-2S] binding domain-containing protein n=1 Tax=Ruegeria halocynthiae TaxID=985054 RepID=A0A1H3FHL3_9RHOB|nr:(2Fe-2S)-binding protein [Ruegeria halocynthiae]SDX90237.1 BFD-like [2Fe-2S] binding domain-containing protein [Ruegeria halocynthiae]
MIVCHCTNISDHDIRAAINWMRTADPQTIITPGKIYHALGKSADCGGCMPLFLDTMRSDDNLRVPMQLRALRTRPTEETHDEGRSQGYRISQQITAA